MSNHRGRAKLRSSLWRRLLRNRLVRTGFLLLLPILVLLCLGPRIAPYPVSQQSYTRFSGPTSEHWLGTDEYGRDTLSRLILGTRVSLVVGVMSVLLGGVAGTFLGIIAGYSGGWIDTGISKFADGVLSFPSVLIGVIVLFLIGQGTYNVAIAIAIAFLPRFIRLARASTLALSSVEYIEACRAIGVSNFRILTRHIFPNIGGSILVMSTLWIASGIRLEASLSFLGLGAQPPAASWGLMLRDGMSAILFSPWLSVFSGLMIFVSILGFNVIGDGLRDTLDPRLRNLSN